jgi:hypothetical protein
MSAAKGLVLDANILLRAVFGTRVRSLLNTYEDVAAFYSPDVCVADARKHIPSIGGWPVSQLATKVGCPWSRF